MITEHFKPKGLFGASFHYKGDKKSGINISLNRLQYGDNWKHMAQYIQEILPQKLEVEYTFAQVGEPGYCLSEADFISTAQTNLHQAIKTYWQELGFKSGTCEDSAKCGEVKDPSEAWIQAEIDIITNIYFLRELGWIKDNEYNGLQYHYEL
jgi:hypothetical protein